MNSDQVICHITTAVQDVFSMMLGFELTPGEPYTTKTAPIPHAGVMAFVGLTGDWVGTGGLSCSASFACKMSSQFLLTKFDAVNEEVLDAVAEITNMIHGNVKTALESEVGPLGLSIPTVVLGRNFTCRPGGDAEWVIAPFQDGHEQMEVHFCLTPRRDNQPAFRHLAHHSLFH